MGAICSTTVPVGTRLHWSTDSPACMGQLRQDGRCCGREAQCGRRTKINWTKTAHNTRICICICGYLGLVPIHTHTHTPLCGYGLSTGPTDGLNSWWLRNRSLPDSQQQQQQRFPVQNLGLNEYRCWAWTVIFVQMLSSKISEDSMGFCTPVPSGYASSTYSTIYWYIVNQRPWIGQEFWMKMLTVWTVGLGTLHLCSSTIRNSIIIYLMMYVCIVCNDNNQLSSIIFKWLT